MKKRSMAAIAVFSLISSLSAFEDKPALSRTERAVLISTKVVGTAAGATVGAFAGTEAGSRAAGGGSGNPSADTFADIVGGIPGFIVGTGVGGYVGAKYTRPMALRLLARWHGVSKRVEEVSQHYNVNINQYMPILVTAEFKDSELLLQEVDVVYTLRFGENWKELLDDLFKKYKRKASISVKNGSFKLSGSEKTFVRMVELGAAMSNLYFGANPRSGDEFRDAKRMYKKLGIL